MANRVSDLSAVEAQAIVTRANTNATATDATAILAVETDIESIGQTASINPQALSNLLTLWMGAAVSAKFTVKVKTDYTGLDLFDVGALTNEQKIFLRGAGVNIPTTGNVAAPIVEVLRLAEMSSFFPIKFTRADGSDLPRLEMIGTVCLIGALVTNVANSTAKETLNLGNANQTVQQLLTGNAANLPYSQSLAFMSSMVGARLRQQIPSSQEQPFLGAAMIVFDYMRIVLAFSDLSTTTLPVDLLKTAAAALFGSHETQICTRAKVALQYRECFQDDEIRQLEPFAETDYATYGKPYGQIPCFDLNNSTRGKCWLVSGVHLAQDMRAFSKRGADLQPLKTASRAFRRLVDSKERGASGLGF